MSKAKPTQKDVSAAYPHKAWGRAWPYDPVELIRALANYGRLEQLSGGQWSPYGQDYSHPPQWEQRTPEGTYPWPDVTLPFPVGVPDLPIRRDPPLPAAWANTEYTVDNQARLANAAIEKLRNGR